MGAFVRHARSWAVALALVAALAPVAMATADTEVRRADGTRASVADVAQAMATADVVYLGEEHDDPVAHRLQSELLAQACDRAGKRPVALAMEMFERDVQLVLDEYLADAIREKDLLTDARPWPNYATDYRPLVEFAKSRGIPVIAANAPKRYVSRVGRLGQSGIDGLSATARGFLAPGPVPSASAAY
ncbi:MAG: ChaN family lipoprotein, partial [Candidatus Sericytochromatia bacterium]